MLELKDVVLPIHLFPKALCSESEVAVLIVPYVAVRSKPAALYALLEPSDACNRSRCAGVSAPSKAETH